MRARTTSAAAVAVAALLMWFWLSAYAICIGAELNAQIELFTTVDTTIDERSPRGRRGAYVADRVQAPEPPTPPTPTAAAPVPKAPTAEQP